MRKLEEDGIFTEGDFGVEEVDGYDGVQDEKLEDEVFGKLGSDDEEEEQF